MSMVIAIDYSGSFADEIHENKLIEQLRLEMGHEKVRLIFFTEKVDFDESVDLYELDLGKIGLQYGGSSFRRLSELLRKDPVDHLILITDGYVNGPPGVMERTAGIITVRTYHELDPQDMGSFKGQLGDSNVFFEILEPKMDDDGSDLDDGRAKNFEEWKEGRRNTPFGPSASRLRQGVRLRRG